MQKVILRTAADRGERLECSRLDQIFFSIVKMVVKIGYLGLSKGRV